MCSEDKDLFTLEGFKIKFRFVTFGDAKNF